MSTPKRPPPPPGRITTKTVEILKMTLPGATINLSVGGPVEILTLQGAGLAFANARLFGKVSEVAIAGENQYSDQGVLEVHACVRAVQEGGGDIRLLQASLTCRPWHVDGGRFTDAPPWRDLPEWAAAALALMTRSQRKYDPSNVFDWVNYYEGETPAEVYAWLEKHRYLPGQRGAGGRTIQGPPPGEDGLVRRSDTRAYAQRGGARQDAPSPSPAPKGEPASSGFVDG